MSTIEELLPELAHDDVDEGLEPIATSPLFELPSFDLPKFKLPRLRRPRFRMPKLPRVRVPAELLEDGALLAGLAAIAAGAGWIFPPAAAIVGGAFLVWLGLRAAGRADKNPQLHQETVVVDRYVHGDYEED